MVHVEHEYEIGREHRGLSVFDFLDAVAGPVDRKRVLSAARQGLIVLNGEPALAGATLSLGDHLELTAPVESLARAGTHRVPVLHSAEGLLVGDKPSGLAFDAGRRGGAHALEALAQAAGTQARLRPVHRLDKQTSGVVVTATDRAHEEALTAAFRAGEARVEYLAVVRGRIRGEAGEIDVPLAKKDRSQSHLVADERHGTPAVTAWTVEERLRGFTILRLVPQRGGRSHQVRAHLAALGHPALCDRLYREDDRLLLSQLKLDYRPKRGRPERPILARPALHAERFVHGDLVVAAPLPEDLAVPLTQLRRLFPVS
jgi:RluA family pseudouridine synthase